MATQISFTTLEHLHRRLLEARANTDRLFQIVREDALYDRPIPERHRILFYIGHLEAFDWNLFRDHLLFLESFSRGFDQLFAFGIDPVDGGLPSDKPHDWPVVSEVRNYVQAVRVAIDDALAAGNFPTLATANSPGAEVLLQVAIEHRLMHAETLAYMFHQLRASRKIPQAQPDADSVPGENTFVEIPAGSTRLGLSREAPVSFGWDNEFESQAVDVPRFRISKFMVTNAEFLRFVEDGGYENSRHWSPGDWQWKERCGILQPAFWNRRGSAWIYRGMFEELGFPSDWPVYVSHAEASAFARWANGSLPTEAQWHRAAYGTSQSAERDYPWGHSAPATEHGNFDFRRWDPNQVNAFPANISAFGAVGMLGNGWEWTSTPFAPFPGFAPAAFYPGYSANFFDGQHYVIKGGSARTAACLLRRSFRNWFQPHYQYAYTGFRCVTE
jgi:gamma-glutamyl hercynylcysteine S-oxide synthase